MRLILLFTLVSLSFPSLSLASPLRVLFDQGHGQAFTIEKGGELQLDQLADKLRDKGWQVSATTAPLTPQKLSEVHAVIISGPFEPLSATEIKALGGFLYNGGRLVIMLHIASPLVPLLAELGVASANGVVREWDKSQIIDGEPLNFKVSRLQAHPLTEGLTYFSLYGGWPLRPIRKDVRTLAGTSPMAWVDLNRDNALSSRDAVQEFGVLVTGSVGKGEFAVFADDAIFQNRFLKGENDKLAENLGRWLRPGK